VMIRPRGGDFVYAEPEVRLMEQQIDEARAAGAAGVVVGTLLRDRQIDRIAAARLLRRSRPMEVVFHRAIDVTPDPLDALEALLTLAFDRVLTSGGAATALAGAETIRRMVRLAGNGLTVIAGGSVRGRNVRQLVELTGVREVHARDVTGIREAMN
jgi:copper homeostasis protein